MTNDKMTKEELSRFGKYLASSRRIVEGTCEVCGKSFQGTTKRRYCSNTCVVRAHRERQRSSPTTPGESSF